jgi:antitoxin ParD1/3/4
MPTRNVNLTDELDRFVANHIKKGRYANASDVVRAGLRALEREEATHAAEVARLKRLIAEGEASGIVDQDADEMFDELMAEIDRE